MYKKIFFKISNNIFLKIMSVIIALLVWLILVNISDPTTKLTISGVVVRLENEDYLIDKGYNIDISEGNKISVLVTGPKSKITNLSSSDILATANLKTMSPFSDYANIDVSIYQNGNRITDVRAVPNISSIKLDIKNRKQKNVSIVPEIIGIPKDGYIVSNLSIEPKEVRVVGEEEVVDKIDVLKAIDVFNPNEKAIKKEVEVVAYDKEGNKINDKSLTFSYNKVLLTANVFHSKKVPLKYAIYGKPKDGLVISSIVASQKEITISSENDLSKVTEFKLPDTAIDVNNIDTEKTYRFWLSDYAPLGINVVSDNVITVVVKLDKQNNVKKTTS